MPAPSGLIGWWPGDGNALDIAGANNGVLQGGAVATATGLNAQAFGFDGTNAFVQIADSPTLRPSNLTVEAWVRFTSLNSPAVGSSPAGQQYIVFKQNSHTSNFEGFALTKTRSGNRDFFSFGVASAGGTTIEAISTTSISVGVWYHVAGVRTSNAIQLYVNGSLQRQLTVTFPQDYGNFPLYFGTTGQAYHDHKLSGTLDEVGLYDRALSAAEISELYIAGADGRCKTPSITTQPVDRVAPAGALVAFSVGAAGSAPLSYQWERNGEPLTNGLNISGATSSTLNLANVQTNDSSQFFVIVSNAFGAVTSATVTLVVDGTSQAPGIVGAPFDQTITAGSPVQFSANVTGSAPIGCRWFCNGLPLTDAFRYSGATTTNLLLSYALPENAGNYWVVVTNLYGAATSTVASLTVLQPTNCLPSPAGLVAWWPGDGNAYDIVGTNHGILRGGATADTNAVVAQGILFDGTNKYVEIPDSPVLKPALLSVECWVKFINLQSPGTSTYLGQQYLVFKQNTRYQDFEGYVLSKDRTGVGDIILWEVTSAAGQLIRIDSLTVMASNTWYHLVGVRDTNFIALYVNGVLEAATNVSFPQNYGTNPVYFGTSGQAYWDRRLNGVLDEVSLYDRPLSASEIAALYNAGPAGKCKAPTFVLNPQSTNVLYGSSLTLTSGVVGVKPMSLQWQKNQNAVPGASSQSIAFTNIQMADGGSYSLLASNLYGIRSSAPGLVDVRLADMQFGLISSPTQNNVGITLSGTPGVVLGIQGSTNLANAAGWFGLTNLTLVQPTNQWQDPEPAVLPEKYYRVVPGPVPGD